MTLQSTRILVTGLGGAGCRILDTMAQSGLTGPFYAAVSTDTKSLAGCRVGTRQRIGTQRDMSFGTGEDVERGRQAAEESQADLVRLFSNLDLAFMVGGLGGGTGSGAMPVACRIAREQGAMVIAVVALPFEFEGKARVDRARSALDAVRAESDLLVVIPNDRVTEGNASRLKDAFARSSDLISNLVASLWRSLSKPGYLNFDFDDLRAMVRETGGTCTAGFGDAVGRDRSIEALNALMKGKLMEDGQRLQDAPAAIISMVGGPDLSVGEVDGVMTGITARLPATARVLLGVMIDEGWRNRLTVTVLVSEAWGTPLERQVPASSTAAGPRSPEKISSRKRTTKPGDLQQKLNLDFVDDGPFKNAPVTHLGGENLDTPTFIRRSITIRDG